MMGGPIEGPPATPNVEGKTDLPFLGRPGADVSPTSTMTTLRPEDPPTDQAMTSILSWSDHNLPLERWCACREVTQRQSELACGKAAMADGTQASNRRKDLYDGPCYHTSSI
jgi:hypothetical protein